MKNRNFSKIDRAKGLVFRELKLNNEGFDNRLIAQKKVYLLQGLGSDLGYSYNWYVRGPYSASLGKYLCNNLDALSAVDYTDEKLRKPVAENVSKINALAIKKDEGLTETAWYELLATMLFIAKNKHNFDLDEDSGKDAIVNKLRHKRPDFNLDVCNKAYDALNHLKIFENTEKEKEEAEKISKIRCEIKKAKKPDNQLKKVKYINDPVYGGIGVTQMELEIIDTPIFQRLRGLRQLARVNYVFPGAEHSRFVHSLGVLHITGLMAKHLRDRNELTDEDVIKIRAAALLHDIGHYPFSHLGESVYGYFEDENYAEKIIQTRETDGEELYRLSSYKSKAADHERLGSYIVLNNKEIQNILIKYGLDPKEIGDIFTGKCGSNNLVCTQMLHSSLDADRLDYLLRDSFQTGVRYGLVDLDYLIRMLMVVDTPETMGGSTFGDSRKILVCNKKGQHVVEHFLMSRYFHYSQVIYHKTNASFEGMIKAMLIKLVKHDKDLYRNLEDIHKDINSKGFLQFNDSYIEYRLLKYYEECIKNKKDVEFVELYEMYRDRKRPKVVFEIKDLHDVCPSPQFTILKKVLKSEPDKITEIVGSEKWGYQIVPITIEKIQGRNTSADLREVHEEDYREAVKLYDTDTEKVTYLAEDSLSVVNKLANYKNEFIRIYVLGGSDDDHKRITKEIKSLIMT